MSNNQSREKLAGWLTTLCISGAKQAEVYDGAVAHCNEDSSFFLVALVPDFHTDTDETLTIYLIQANNAVDAFTAALSEAKPGYFLSVHHTGYSKNAVPQILRLIELLLPDLQSKVAKAFSHVADDLPADLPSDLLGKGEVKH